MTSPTVERTSVSKTELYIEACEIARGHSCGNCNRAEAKKWRCIEDGCLYLRDEIYGALERIYKKHSIVKRGRA